MQYVATMGCESTKGPRQRNEDRGLVDPGAGFALVADGMGGAAAGQEASSLAVEAARTFLTSRGARAARSPEDVTRFLRELVEQVNREVHRRGTSSPELRGMGTTLVLVLLRADRYYVANVGDSRAYLVRRGNVTQLSKDHSLVQERVDHGLITPEEADTQPDRNILTRALGVEPETEPHIAEGRVRPGDLFVLTSDGVHGVVSRTEIAAAARPGDPTKAAGDLVSRALAKGTRDNATAAVIEIPQGVPGEDRDEVSDPGRVPTCPTKSRSGAASVALWLALGTLLLVLALFLGRCLRG